MTIPVCFQTGWSKTLRKLRKEITLLNIFFNLVGKIWLARVPPSFLVSTPNTCTPAPASAVEPTWSSSARQPPATSAPLWSSVPAESFLRSRWCFRGILGAIKVIQPVSLQKGFYQRCGPTLFLKQTTQTDFTLTVFPAKAEKTRNMNLLAFCSQLLACGSFFSPFFKLDTPCNLNKYTK